MSLELADPPNKQLIDLNIPNLLAIAECATGGAVMSRFVRDSGASKYYVGGINTYRINEKVSLLGVDRDVATEDNCVSARVACAMARGVSKLFDAHVGIATTGYLEKSDEIAGQTPFIYCAYYISADSDVRNIDLGVPMRAFDREVDHYHNSSEYTTFAVKIAKPHGMQRDEFQTYIANIVYNSAIDILSFAFARDCE